MINASQASVVGSTITPPNERAVVSGRILASAGIQEEAPVVQPTNPAAVAQAKPILLYNSFEFAYKQIIGKIVLDYREPETGEVIQQIPSEKHLRQYAEAQKAARTGAREPSGSRETARETKIATRPAGVETETQPVPTHVAPAQASAPQLDIKV